MICKTISAIAVILALCFFTMAATKPDFNGSWVMDRSRSFGLPGNMQQTMTVTQTQDQIVVETKLIQPDNERTVKDTYVLDGKEHEFTPLTAPNAPPTKAKRTASWLPGSSGIVVTEVTTAETEKGPVTTQMTRKWTFTGDGELTIALYIDGPNGSFEAKRIFLKQ
jgi:hypothetical protein